VAALPDSVLDHETLLEANALEIFETAAGASGAAIDRTLK